MMHSFILMAMVTVLWAVVGYSLAIGEGSPVVGDLRYFLLNGVGSAPNADYAGTIPHQTYMIFQLMFAIITPALITGAFAERMKFSAMLLFMVLWCLIVYFPLAHMVWGKGGFLNAFLGGKVPCFDFAGGTLGALLTGLFATNAVNDGLKDAAGKPLPLGLVDGNAPQVVNQLIGIGISWALAIVGTIVILKICDVLIGVRVEQEHEIKGLDLSQHGEEGYILEA